MAWGDPFPDPLDHRYGMKSAPQADRGVYPTGALINRRLTHAHDGERTAEVVDDRVLGRVNPIERRRAVHSMLGNMLVTLMFKHESMHLGQLSAWHSAMGLARVAL